MQRKQIKIILGVLVFLLLLPCSCCALIFALITYDARGYVGNCYHVQSPKVLYRTSFKGDFKEVEGADAATFKIIPDKTGNCVKIAFAKDKNHLYSRGQVVRNIDIDLDTFQVLSQNYSKDKSRVYYNYPSTSNSIKNQINEISGADSQTFQTLEDSEYGKDKNKVYYEGLVAPDIDANTFKDLTNGYSKDSKYVYFKSKVVEDADADSFKFILEKYAKDKSYAYLEGKKIDGSDGSSFEVLKEGYGMAKDKNHCYIHGKSIQECDGSSFQLINDNYYKDKNHVYFRESIVENVDMNSFRIIVKKEKDSVFNKKERYELSSYAKDDKRYYYKGKVLDNFNPKDFEN